MIGSQPRRIKPEKRSKNRETISMVTTELFAMGARSAVRDWSNKLQTLQENDQSTLPLRSIEEISVPEPQDKIKGQLPSSGSGNIILETVLHASELDLEMIRAFENYLKNKEIPFKLGRRFFAKGLYFQALEIPVIHVKDIAVFTGVRVVRQMPELRQFYPFTRSSSLLTPTPQLPEEQPISENVNVAVLDGGIPDNHPITKWVHTNEPDGMEPANDRSLCHGTAVTSAALFGHIDPMKPIPRPYSYIDHHRILDSRDQDRYELYEVLNRIASILKSNNYDFINLSLGPRLPINDNDVHAWTAVLDEYLSKNLALAMIAVGNDGESDTILGYDRIQVPSDCVNALAIGACDKPGKNWKRTPYSSKGPGRSPGIVKPDLVDFGGVIGRKFVVISPDINPSLCETGGTSYATPSVLRLGVGIRAHFGMNLNHLAIRALLVHTCENNGQPYTEVGWGRVARTLNDVVLCDDDTIRIVYQGDISPSKIYSCTNTCTR